MAMPTRVRARRTWQHAGMANRTAVFCLPGSTGACRTAWEGILQAQLDNRTRPCNFVPHVRRSDPA